MPRPSLVVFPFAGGAAHNFAGLCGSLRHARPVPLDYPGHGRRMSEALTTDFRALAADAYARVVERRLTSEPYGLYGHSMGGVVAWWVARQLENEGLPRPRVLVVSGSCPPWVRPKSTFHQLSDGELVDALGRFGAAEPAVFDHPQLRDLLLPVIRADLTAIETFVVSPDPPLPGLSVLSLYGTEDEHVGRATAAEWGRVTTGQFRVEAVPGGHFFPLHESTERAARAIDEAISGQG